MRGQKVNFEEKTHTKRKKNGTRTKKKHDTNTQKIGTTIGPTTVFVLRGLPGGGGGGRGAPRGAGRRQRAPVLNLCVSGRGD